MVGVVRPPSTSTDGTVTRGAGTEAAGRRAALAREGAAGTTPAGADNDVGGADCEGCVAADAAAGAAGEGEIVFTFDVWGASTVLLLVAGVVDEESGAFAAGGAATRPARVADTVAGFVEGGAVEAAGGAADGEGEVDAVSPHTRAAPVVVVVAAVLVAHGGGGTGDTARIVVTVAGGWLDPVVDAVGGCGGGVGVRRAAAVGVAATGCGEGETFTADARGGEAEAEGCGAALCTVVLGAVTRTVVSTGVLPAALTGGEAEEAGAVVAALVAGGAVGRAFVSTGAVVATTAAEAAVGGSTEVEGGAPAVWCVVAEGGVPAEAARMCGGAATRTVVSTGAFAPMGPEGGAAEEDAGREEEADGGTGAVTATGDEDAAGGDAASVAVVGGGVVRWGRMTIGGAGRATEARFTALSSFFPSSEEMEGRVRSSDSVPETKLPPSSPRRAW